jgi:hypothetical protein
VLEAVRAMLDSGTFIFEPMPRKITDEMLGSVICAVRK